MSSYQVSSMTNQEQELARLRTQAEQLYPLESKLLKEWGGLKSQDHVLEVGCGPGFLTPLLCELAAEGRVTSCDTSQELLSLCHAQKLTIPRFGFQTLRSEAAHIPVSDQSQDFAYLRFVLQHAPERRDLISDVNRCLKEGGTIVILDTDDGLNIQYPENSFVTQLKKDAQEIQFKKGGDRFIGRKVSHLLNELGFNKIQTRVLNFTNSDLPFSTLAKISLGFKSDLCGKRAELESWIQEVQPLAQKGEFFLSAGIVVTTAKKVGF